MARKKVTEQVLKSWDEVNDSLKLIGEAQNAIDTIEAELNDQITDLKTAAKEKSRNMRMLSRSMKRSSSSTRQSIRTN